MSLTLTAAPTRRRVWAVIGVVAVALNLRTPIAAVSALLHPLSADLALPGWSVSVLATLPTLCLGLFAFVGPALRRRVGDERLILGCVAVIAAGDLARAIPGTVALFAGTTAIAAGIGIANVTIPGLIKRDFPAHVAGMTGLYAATLTLGAAAASAAAERLAGGTAWGWALAVVCVPIALVALVVWLPAATVPPACGAVTAGGPVHRHPVAWWVTGFFGTSALLAYSVLGWLPTLAADQGVVADGGAVLAVSSLTQALGALVGPVLVRHLPDVRVLSTAAAALTAIALVGVAESPVAALVWASAAVLGLAQGVAFQLALTFIGLRSPDAATATGLSALAQGVGYLVGVAGPLGAGLVHEATGGWAVPVGGLVVVALAQVVLGLGAGRDRLVTFPAPTGAAERVPSAV